MPQQVVELSRFRIIISLFLGRPSRHFIVLIALEYQMPARLLSPRDNVVESCIYRGSIMCRTGFQNPRFIKPRKVLLGRDVEIGRGAVSRREYTPLMVALAGSSASSLFNTTIMQVEGPNCQVRITQRILESPCSEPHTLGYIRCRVYVVGVELTLILNH